MVFRGVALPDIEGKGLEILKDCLRRKYCFADQIHDQPYRFFDYIVDNQGFIIV